MLEWITATSSLNASTCTVPSTIKGPPTSNSNVYLSCKVQLNITYFKRQSDILYILIAPSIFSHFHNNVICIYLPPTLDNKFLDTNDQVLSNFVPSDFNTMPRPEMTLTKCVK